MADDDVAVVVEPPPPSHAASAALRGIASHTRPRPRAVAAVGRHHRPPTPPMGLGRRRFHLPLAGAGPVAAGSRP